jgi:hypothetical protein
MYSKVPQMPSAAIYIFKIFGGRTPPKPFLSGQSPPVTNPGSATAMIRRELIIIIIWEFQTHDER